jgi:hypothetical protein
VTDLGVDGLEGAELHKTGIIALVHGC